MESVQGLPKVPMLPCRVGYWAEPKHISAFGAESKRTSRLMLVTVVAMYPAQRTFGRPRQRGRRAP